MRIFLYYFMIVFCCIACTPNKTKKTAQEIINATIVASGADKIDNASITFNFRDKSYKATRQSGIFQLERSFIKNEDTIIDILSNKGFQRKRNSHFISVPDSMETRYTNAVNSVHYFAVLPYGLNDKAVQKKMLEEVTIKGEPYYKIRISFLEEGGGEDFEDVFMYWIHQETFLIDYLAYRFHVNGGGLRFRTLKEQCVKKGIRFVDYNNYKPINTSLSLQDLDKAYEKNQLKKLSEIVLKNVKVELFSTTKNQ